MSENESHHHGKNEIIIIKRHGGRHDGHHGGAWKIAYADFMTAMMAFFLVMWLVNAANEATKAAVASYFNPIKLTDAKPAEKGIRKPGKQAKGENTLDKSPVQGEAKSSGDSAATGEQKQSTAGEKTSYSEADYFQNPYAVLSEIVLQVGEQANVSIKGEGGASDAGPATGADGGEAYRDPFDPDFWTHQVKITSAQRANGAKAQSGEDGKDKAAAAVAAVDIGNENGKGGLSGNKDTNEKGTGGSATTDQTGKYPPEMVAAPAPEKSIDGKKPAAAVSAKDSLKPQELASADDIGATQAQKQKAAEALKAQILGALQGDAGKLAAGLTVEPTQDGLLISLTDQLNQPMFDVGSAVPQRDLVLAMQDIGKILQSRKGAIAIRGHTDGRPYKAGTGDNWALSLNRARSAYYMLVSGGLNEKRINQVTGYADRHLKYPKDPLNPANRRIEILLEGKSAAGG